MYDCDVLLLTGRPSSWNGVISTVLVAFARAARQNHPHAALPRWIVVSFADVSGAALPTPLTNTVAVGAILCALADGHLGSAILLDSGGARSHPLPATSARWT